MKRFNSPSRRDFLTLCTQGMGAAVISTGLMSCNNESDSPDVPVSFDHGVASGDPTQNSVILWTRITPQETATISVSWEIATDAEFTHIIHTGQSTTNANSDYTIKIDAVNLDAGTNYFYRFHANNTQSATGKTKTLPKGNVDKLSMAVLSCSNYPAGFFNVYNMVSKQTDLDVVLHLGDYIYEYERDGYASTHANELNREVLPEGELLSLNDYRTRYAQYRTDEDLQAVHANLAFITVWDDHEVANDTYKDGAENHNENEGSFLERKMAALQAYFEWMPIRPISDDNELEIYRSFQFGDLVDLHMLDTRVLARDKQLEYADYQSADGAFDATALTADLTDTTRTMLGATQRQWLQTQLAQSTGTWQVLGQQVLMGQMFLPAAVALSLMSTSEYARLGALAVLAGRAQASDPTLTSDEIAYLTANQADLTATVIAQLQLPNVPYNLDAWDGYAAEREVILQTAKTYAKNLVVIAGDTHNSWCSNLLDQTGSNVGVEFATTSVSSPGLEYYLGLSESEIPATEAGITQLVEHLQYCNLLNRGFMLLEFTPTKTTSTWHYVDTILDKSYTQLESRRTQATVNIGENIVSIN